MLNLSTTATVFAANIGYRTIYSLFKRCGIVRLLSSAILGELGTVKKALKGGDVKEGINIHKKLYEALLGMKIKYIDVSKCNEGKVVEYLIKKKKRNTPQLMS